jgi:hypothetical protein
MAQLSTTIKLYAEANGVSDVDFTKMFCCKMTQMAKEHISKNGT